MSHKNFKWEFVPNCYTPLESIKGWKKCKICGEFPRVWIFNNGNSCKCCCDTDKYTAGKVISESILSVLKRNNGNCSEYSEHNLRLAWNKWVDTGIPQDKLEEGRW